MQMKVDPEPQFQLPVEARLAQKQTFLKKERKGTWNILSDPQPPSEGFENLLQGSKIQEGAKSYRIFKGWVLFKTKSFP